ncbi:hypothetical protein JW911_00980 [Candidatus Peregrinibacteria bacterium]|nr:hypothetical protein [Candidatus Peregrinibacteria bacterium]
MSNKSENQALYLGPDVTDESTGTQPEVVPESMSLLDIIADVQSEAKEARESDVLQKINDFFSLEDELDAADAALAKLPKNLRNKAIERMAPRIEWIKQRKNEILRNAGVKTDFCDKNLKELKTISTFGDLAKLVEGAISLGLLTAERNPKGNISFHTVRYVKDKRPVVQDKLKELRKAVHQVSMDLAKKAESKKPLNGNKK